MNTARPAVAVGAIGVAQIVSWGTLFYSIAVLGPPMRVALGIGESLMFGSFTAGLFVSGAFAPAVGRMIDVGGGRRVLTGGSVIAAAALAMLATASGALGVLAGWLLAGLAMAFCLYDAAFAALFRIPHLNYRRAVTGVTLLGGLASTVFWPLAQWLLDAFGWRAAFATFAATHLVVALPLYVLALPRRGASQHHAVQKPSPGPLDTTFLWLASAFSIAAFMASAISAHLIGQLKATGLSAREAVAIGALIGPMQVAGRLIEMGLASRVPARVFGMLAFSLMATGLAILTQVRGVWWVALLFVFFYGWSNGVMTIVRGTVPAEVFPDRPFGALLGRLARPQFIARAIAPGALAVGFAVDPDRMGTPYALTAGALVAVYAYWRGSRRVSRARERSAASPAEESQSRRDGEKLNG